MLRAQLVEELIDNLSDLDLYEEAYQANKENYIVIPKTAQVEQVIRQDTLKLIDQRIQVEDVE